MGSFETHILNFVKDFLTSVGYPGVFLLMAIEGFGIPIPSELTMPFSGFLSTSAGGSKFVLSAAVIVGTLGEVSGGIVAYAVGYFGGRPLVARYGRVVLLSEEELERGHKWFERYGDWVVLVVRLLPAIRSFIAFPAGVVRMPFWRFLLYSAIGSAVWCTMLALIGQALGKNWNSISNHMRGWNIVIIVVVLALIAFAVYKRVSTVRRRKLASPVASD